MLTSTFVSFVSLFTVAALAAKELLVGSAGYVGSNPVSVNCLIVPWKPSDKHRTWLALGHQIRCCGLGCLAARSSADSPRAFLPCNALLQCKSRSAANLLLK